MDSQGADSLRGVEQIRSIAGVPIDLPVPVSAETVERVWLTQHGFTYTEAAAMTASERAEVIAALNAMTDDAGAA